MKIYSTQLMLNTLLVALVSLVPTADISGSFSSWLREWQRSTVAACWNLCVLQFVLLGKTEAPCIPVPCCRWTRVLRRSLIMM